MIKEQYEEVLGRISEAARSVGRSPNAVKLMVVTKAHGVDAIQEVVAAGARLLGENYVEEAISKISSISQSNVEWQMIGHVQSRKAKQVCKYFSCVHSIDRMKIATRLNRYAGEMGRNLQVLLECNASGEVSKFGFPVWDETKWHQIRDEISPILVLSHLKVKGLMTIPPWNPDPEASRPYYKLIRRLQDYLAGEFPGTDWSELSMGMSNDFEVAIQEGATLVRIGSAIIGPRI